MPTKIMPGTKAPALSLPLVGGGTFTLADETPEAVTMILVYRGYHCPVCKDFLAGQVEPRIDAFAEAGVKVVAVSMDPEDRATKTKSEWGLEKTPIAYGMTEEDARNWGLYLSSSIKEAETATFAEPGTFWVKPDGELYLVDIATMPFARPNLDILLSKVGAVGAGYPARGTKA
ncbi:Peroxiredoxin [Roseivivax lentus]|uniref:Peroxiredoxin n=1 Tax=Roseivivax lentus TaxID=633194 RepID=A0A1N7N292_9RHOB|nr:redoxin domain-containing protein [Roseivivax lentus]SIS92506.1 Peroxiredoxin [Roseivivax lentus]